MDLHNYASIMNLNGIVSPGNSFLINLEISDEELSSLALVEKRKLLRCIRNSYIVKLFFLNCNLKVDLIDSLMNSIGNKLILRNDGLPIECIDDQMSGNGTSHHGNRDTIASTTRMDS